MDQKISIAGLVATTPRHLQTADGLDIVSFRLASSSRTYDRAKGRWVDSNTNWYTITGFRTLATTTSESVGKGDRVIVIGTIRVRDWDNGDRSGTSVEIEADAIGHDLNWGISKFERTIHTRLDPEPDREDLTLEV
jgi:single-strand DNA-binding protein